MTIKQCIVCGAEFTPVSRGARGHAQVYCSVSCSLRAVRPVRDVTCRDCGVTFVHTGRGRCYRCLDCRQKCARATAAKWQAEHRVKNTGVGSGGAQWSQDNHEWKADKSPESRVYVGAYRRRCFKLWEPICVVCGSVERLVVHHVDGSQKNYSSVNLVPVCFCCHKKIHCKRWKTAAQYEAALFELWPEGRCKIAEKNGDTQ